MIIGSRQRRYVVAVLAILLATLPADVAVAVLKTTPRAHKTAVISSPPPTVESPSPTTSPPGPPDVVAGRVIPSAGIVTVADALARARVQPHDGRLLGIVSHRPVASAGSPALIFVNGQGAMRSTHVAPGSRITFVAGHDRVEGTKTVHITTPADPTGTGLYVGGTAGLTVETVGAVSREVVHTTVVRKRVLGHLKVPGAIALTFDDGPDPTWTPQVLAVLAKHHVAATFCEIGREVNAHPQITRQIVAAGHVLCDHTQNHDEHIASRSQQQMYDEINDCKTAMTKASGGVVPRFFRAPGGDWSTQVERVARSDGLTPLKWTVDPRDWARPGTDAIVDNVVKHVRPGGVILLHDGGGDRSETLAALGRLLDMLPKLGYTFTTPSP